MKRFKKQLLNEINNNFNDINNKIVESINWEQVKLNNESKQKTSREKAFKFVLLPVLSCILLCVMIVLPFMFNNDNGAGLNQNYVLTISINPRVELTANSQDIVTNQKGLNEDGCLLLLKENLVGKPLESAVNDVVKLSGDMGYLTNAHNIKFAIKTEKGNFDYKKQEKIRENMSAFVIGYGGPECNIVPLSEQEIEDIENYYSNHNLSEFELTLANKFKEHLDIVTRKKLYDTNQLLSYLKTYIKDSEEIIPNFGDGIMHLADYAMKYKFDLRGYNLSRLTYEDVEEIYEDLMDLRDDLFEAVNLFDEGKSEDDFKDMLEDLFEMVKDMIKEEIDD